MRRFYPGTQGAGEQKVGRAARRIPSRSSRLDSLAGRPQRRRPSRRSDGAHRGSLRVPGPGRRFASRARLYDRQTHLSAPEIDTAAPNADGAKTEGRALGPLQQFHHANVLNQKLIRCRKIGHAGRLFGARSFTVRRRSSHASGVGPDTSQWTPCRSSCALTTASDGVHFSRTGRRALASCTRVGRHQGRRQGE